MNGVKFIIAGKDSYILQDVRKALSAAGYIFLGFADQTQNLLRQARNMAPDLIVIQAGEAFHEIQPVIEIIDEEMLAACVLLLNSRNDDIFAFLGRTRAVTFAA
ncbi:MAG: hypothetical protein Q7J78_00790, partial [Clostridiales bacterium]|nr:hypothetical protein [Clostridiales bacterium]